jgi:hypothetical protein
MSKGWKEAWMKTEMAAKWLSDWLPPEFLLTGGLLVSIENEQVSVRYRIGWAMGAAIIFKVHGRPLKIK